jgi:hypothetical protein
VPLPFREENKMPFVGRLQSPYQPAFSQGFQQVASVLQNLALLKIQQNFRAQEAETEARQTFQAKESKLDRDQRAKLVGEKKPVTWGEPYRDASGALLQKSSTGQVKSVLGRKPAGKAATTTIKAQIMQKAMKAGTIDDLSQAELQIMNWSRDPLLSKAIQLVSGDPANWALSSEMKMKKIEEFHKALKSYSDDTRPEPDYKWNPKTRKLEKVR